MKRKTQKPELSTEKQLPENELQELQKQVEYYRFLSEQAGKRTVREIDQLVRLFDDHKKIESQLTGRLLRDKLINTISTSLLAAPADNLNKAIIYGMQLVGLFFSLDHLYIIQLNEQDATAIITHDWFDENFDRSFPAHPLILSEDSVWLREQFTTHEPFYNNRSNGFADSVIERYFTINGIQSLVLTPLFSGERLIGIFCLESICREFRRTDNDDIALKIVANVYANALTHQRIDNERHILEEQLQIRQRMDSLGTLAGGIAHDFNNLLVVIIGNLDLLLQEKIGLSPDQHEYISEALQAAKRATKLTAGIQSLSHGAISHQTIIDVYDVADEVFTLLERTTDKLIEKHLLIRPGRFILSANEDQLHQVFLNLGTNAAHAIEEHGCRPGDRIELSANKYLAGNQDKRGLAPGQYAHFMFRDTGIGMSSDIRKRAFDPLFTTKRSARKGQGLGLAMVYNIITKNHDGFIDLESKPGEGTTVHIYLPLAKKAATYAIAPITRDRRGTETILVIEDEDAVRDAVERSLNFYGYTVLTAMDGEEGLFKYNKQKSDIDLVLLDLTMPKIHGDIVYERILELCPDAKVVVTTGHAETTMERFTRAKGFLPKPYEIGTLGEMIRNVLDMT